MTVSGSDDGLMTSRSTTPADGPNSPMSRVVSGRCQPQPCAIIIAVNDASTEGSIEHILSAVGQENTGVTGYTIVPIGG